MAQDPPVSLHGDFTEATKSGPAEPSKTEPNSGDGPDKGTESIERHKPEEALDMKGPDGSNIRQQAANEAYDKDWEKYNSDRADKYAKIEKKSVVDKNDVRDQTKDKLTPEFNREA